jgi:hypothetical protein
MLFETEDVKQNPVAVPDDFSGTDEQVRRLILNMSDESKKVTDEDFPQAANPEGFEPKGKLADEGLEISARVLVNIGDKMISNLFAKYALDDPEQFYADESDLIDIAEPLEHYFKESRQRVPPWALALFSAAMVIFQKFSVARVLREKNLELKAYKEKTESLQRQIDEKKKEKELKNLVNELENVN